MDEWLAGWLDPGHWTVDASGKLTTIGKIIK
jgi:hypothetical protein